MECHFQKWVLVWSGTKLQMINTRSVTKTLSPAQLSPWISQLSVWIAQLSPKYTSIRSHMNTSWRFPHVTPSIIAALFQNICERFTNSVERSWPRTADEQRGAASGVRLLPYDIIERRQQQRPRRYCYTLPVLTKKRGSAPQTCARACHFIPLRRQAVFNRPNSSTAAAVAAFWHVVFWFWSGSVALDLIQVQIGATIHHRCRLLEQIYIDFRSPFNWLRTRCLNI